VLAPDHAVVAITYSAAEPHLRTIRDLSGQSLIAVVSVSEYFLEMASAVLAPAIGRRHSLQTVFSNGLRVNAPTAADVILCDTLTYPVVRSRCRAAVVLPYPLISELCVDEVGRALQDGGCASERGSRRRSGKPRIDGRRPRPDAR
jgi:hypothetical protein